MVASVQVQHEIEQFLYREMAILEARKFNDWLELLTPDVMYVVPNARDDGSLSGDGVIARENFIQLKAHMMRLADPANPSQIPAQRAKYFVSNVIVGEEDAGTLPIKASMIVYSVGGSEQAHYPVSCDYKLRRDGDAWKIVYKKVYLLANNQALRQLPFI